jgi:hypothetical protein
MTRRLLTCDLEERQLLVGGNILKVDESLDVQVDLVPCPLDRLMYTIHRFLDEQGPRRLGPSRLEYQ